MKEAKVEVRGSETRLHGDVAPRRGMFAQKTLWTKFCQGVRRRMIGMMRMMCGYVGYDGHDGYDGYVMCMLGIMDWYDGYDGWI